MALSKFKNQRDKNEPDIIAEFKARGFTVEKMDKPVDLLIGKWGVNYLIEVKNPDTPYYKGTETQVKWIAEWPGQIATISTVEEAAGFCQAVSAARTYDPNSTYEVPITGVVVGSGTVLRNGGGV